MSTTEYLPRVTGEGREGGDLWGKGREGKEGIFGGRERKGWERGSLGRQNFVFPDHEPFVLRLP